MSASANERRGLNVISGTSTNRRARSERLTNRRARRLGEIGAADEERGDAYLSCLGDRPSTRTSHHSKVEANTASPLQDVYESN